MTSVFGAFFAAALALCPPGFRREYGAAMRADFALAIEDEHALHGALGAATYAFGAIGDLLTTALREYAAMIFRDFAYAVRSLAKTPTFTIVVIATLALAIGANVAVFSVLRAVVLAPLPYADPGRLVALQGRQQSWDAIAGGGGHVTSFSLPDYADVTSASSSLIVSSAAWAMQERTMTGHGTPRAVRTNQVTPRFFQTLGIDPELGSLPDPASIRHGVAKSVVISDGLWRDAFGADPSAIGSTVVLDDTPYRVVAVAPTGFAQPDPRRGFARVDIWTYQPEDGAGTRYTRGWRDMDVVARLRPGVTEQTLAAAANRTTHLMALRDPADDQGLQVDVIPLADELVGSARNLLFALFIAVGAVLLVACANVANLLLSRAASRDREFSVRIAIGASRGRIVAQLLIETFALSAVGGVLGLALAAICVSAFLGLHPPVPRADQVSIDGAALAYTFAVVAICTLLAGLAPAFTGSHRDIATALKSAGRGGDASRGAAARNALVVAEIAMSLALVVGAGLVVRSYVLLTSQSLGFSANDLTMIGGVTMPDARYGDDATARAFMDRVLAKVRTVPGVRAATWAFAPPFYSNRYGTSFTVVGRPVRKGSEPATALDLISPDFFRVIGATMLSGRPFTADDRAGTAPVAIVNETFARTFFPTTSALGAHIVPDIGSSGAPLKRTIVGIVADMRSSFVRTTEPMVYLPAEEFPQSGSLVLVSSEPGADPGPSVANAITAVDPLMPQPPVKRMVTALGDNVAVQRLTVFALASLALVALSLALAGIFAVVSYGVTQRTHELGIRMALGADGRHIVAMVLGGAMRLAAFGIVIGLVLAGMATRLLSTQLYATQPLDPGTFVSVTLLVLAAAAFAASLPAQRATRVDPIVALRYE